MSRVVPGIFDTIAAGRFTKRFNSDDFPAFGAPSIETLTPERTISPRCPSCKKLSMDIFNRLTLNQLEYNIPSLNCLTFVRLVNTKRLPSHRVRRRQNLSVLRHERHRTTKYSATLHTLSLRRPTSSASVKLHHNDIRSRKQTWRIACRRWASVSAFSRSIRPSTCNRSIRLFSNARCVNSPASAGRQVYAKHCLAHSKEK